MQKMICPNSSFERKEDTKKCNHRCEKKSRGYLSHLKAHSVSHSSVNEIGNKWQCDFQKSSWCSLNQLDLTYPASHQQGASGHQEKEASAQILKSLWQNLPSRTAALLPSPSSTRNCASLQGRSPPPGLTPELFGFCYRKKLFFLKPGWKPTGLSFPNFQILWSHLRSSKSLMLFPQAGYLILQYNSLLKKILSAEKWPILL